MSGTEPEQQLAGGYVTQVVRAGDTVRRRPGPRAGYVHRLLAHLERAGYDGAPRLLGTDEQGREILTFIPGSVPADRAEEAGVREQRSVAAVARLARRLHDLTAGTALAGEAEVACHNDLSTANTVYDVSAGWWRPVAFIDWDLAAPGRRLADLAHVCWQYAGLGPRRDDPAASGALIRVACDAYGWEDRDALVPAILEWQDQCWRGIEERAGQGDPAMRRLRDAGGARWVREDEAWTRAHRAELERGLRDPSS